MTKKELIKKIGEENEKTLNSLNILAKKKGLQVVVRAVKNNAGDFHIFIYDKRKQSRYLVGFDGCWESEFGETFDVCLKDATEWVNNYSTLSDCYVSPLFEEADKKWYDDNVKHNQREIEEVVERIYKDDFPTDRKCSKSIDCFTGCTPIYIPDQNKEKHLDQIRDSIEHIFMLGRMFGLAEARYYNEQIKQEKQ